MGNSKKKAGSKKKQQLEALEEKRRREEANLAAIERQNAEAEKKRAEQAAQEAAVLEKKARKRKRVIQASVGVLLVGVVCAGSLIAREATLPESYKELRTMSAVSAVDGSQETTLLEDAARDAGAKDIMVWRQTSDTYDDMILMLVTYPDDADTMQERWTESSYKVDTSADRVVETENTDFINGRDYIQKKVTATLDTYIGETGVEASYQITKCDDGMVIALGKNASAYAEAMGYIIRENPHATMEEQFKLLKKHFQKI